MLSSDLSVAEIRSFYVRGRNALLVRGRISPIYLDYYLHLMQHGLRYEETADAMLKDALAALALHLCSRPQDEVCAWTINIHQPLLNLFVTGGSRPGRVTGRIFSEDVKDSGHNIFIAQTTRPHHSPRQSLIDFSGIDILRAVEHYYSQSEQRLTRLFRRDDEEFVMLSAEPDCDEAWLAGLPAEKIGDLEKDEHLVALESRGYVFDCGCSVERLFPLLTRLGQEDLDHIFEDGVAVITCPRCGAIFRTPRDRFDEWLRGQSQDDAGGSK